MLQAATTGVSARAGGAPASNASRISSSRRSWRTLAELATGGGKLRVRQRAAQDHDRADDPGEQKEGHVVDALRHARGGTEYAAPDRRTDEHGDRAPQAESPDQPLAPSVGGHQRCGHKIRTLYLDSARPAGILPHAGPIHSEESS